MGNLRRNSKVLILIKWGRYKSITYGKFMQLKIVRDQLKHPYYNADIIIYHAYCKHLINGYRSTLSLFTKYKPSRFTEIQNSLTFKGLTQLKCS